MELDNATVPSAHCTTLQNTRAGPWSQHDAGYCAWGAKVFSKAGPQPIFTMKDTTVANTWAAAMGSAGGGRKIKHDKLRYKNGFVYISCLCTLVVSLPFLGQRSQ